MPHALGSWRYMGFPVFHAVIAVVVTLLTQGQSEYSDFLLTLWLLWIPASWFLFHGHSKLWFLPLAAGAPFWLWAAWLAWR